MLNKNLESLVNSLRSFILPCVEVDKDNKTFRIVNDGLLFNNLTRAHYVIKGYKNLYSIECAQDYSI